MYRDSEAIAILLLFFHLREIVVESDWSAFEFSCISIYQLMYQILCNKITRLDQKF